MLFNLLAGLYAALRLFIFQPTIIPSGDPTAEALLRPTAERIVSDMTATAAAFPIPTEEIASVAGIAFGIALLSMLVPLLLLVFIVFVFRKDRPGN